MRVLPIIFLLLMSSGCMAQKMRVSVVVFNYTDHEIGKVHINGQRIIGAFPRADDFGPGGGGAHAGLVFAPGSSTVTWMIGGKMGTPMAGARRKAKGVIPKPPEGSESWRMIFLGVHIFPDRTVKFTITRDLPSYVQQNEP